MKRMLMVLMCFWPALASAQKTYTNADLVDLEVPGAYTNEDLRKLPPLAVQERAAMPFPLIAMPRVEDASFQAAYDDLRRIRAALKTELDYEVGRVAFSESPFAGRTQSAAPRPGYRAKVKGLIQELTKRIELLDGQIEVVLEDARKAGALVDTR